MADFLAAAAQVVGAAVIQEAVSRGVSVVLGKRKEKASQGQYLERLKKAVKEVEFVLERTVKMPITEVSLLRDKIELKHDFIQAAALLSNRHKKRQAPQEITQSVTHSSSSPHGWCPAMFSVSSFIGMTKDDELCLSCDDVKRFEQFADSARNILRDVESGCSLRRYMFFPCPLVRHLFDEWKTLIYRMVQPDQERRFSVWPARLEEERGVEALVSYSYLDHKRPDKSFFLRLVLRLSESMDIVGVAINCLQPFASQFKLVADTAMGELALLASNSQDVFHSSHALPWVGIQEEHNEITQKYRPDPLCCKAKGHENRANNIVTSELITHVFLEEVTSFSFKCHISAQEYSLRSSSANAAGKKRVTRNRSPLLELTVCSAPHVVYDEREQINYAIEIIGDNYEEYMDVSMQQVGETVTSRAISCFLHQPKVTEYWIGWATKHGSIGFLVKKTRAGALKTSGGSKFPTSAKVAEVDVDRGHRQRKGVVIVPK